MFEREHGKKIGRGNGPQIRATEGPRRAYFPVGVRVAVPPKGFERQLDTMHPWLDHTRSPRAQSQPANLLRGDDRVDDGHDEGGSLPAPGRLAP